MREVLLSATLAAALSSPATAVEITINFGYPLLFDNFDGAPDFFGTETPASVTGSFTFESTAMQTASGPGGSTFGDALTDFRFTVLDGASSPIGGFEISDVDGGATTEAGSITVGGPIGDSIFVLPNSVAGLYTGELADDGLLTIVLQSVIFDSFLFDGSLTQFEATLDLQTEFFDVAAGFAFPATSSNLGDVEGAIVNGGGATLGLSVDLGPGENVAVFANSAPVVVPVPPALSLLAGSLLALGLATRKRRTT